MAQRQTPNKRNQKTNLLSTPTLKDIRDLIETMRLSILSDIGKMNNLGDAHEIQDLQKQIQSLENTNSQLQKEIISMKEKISLMEQTHKAILQDNKCLKIEVDKTKTLRAELEEESNRLREEIKTETVKSAQNDAMTLTIDEVQLRSIKQCNLIIFGVPEHTSGSLQERSNHDQSFCQQMLSKIGFNDSLDPPLRFGKIKPGHPRPLRLKCRNLSQKYHILSASKSLKDIPDPSVGIFS